MKIYLIKGIGGLRECVFCGHRVVKNFTLFFVVLYDKSSLKAPQKNAMGPTFQQCRLLFLVSFSYLHFTYFSPIEWVKWPLFYVQGNQLIKGLLTHSIN